MEEYVVKILEIQPVTHNVKHFRFEKPAGYQFNPGQATDVSINKPEWKEEKRPFTFTGLAEDPFLEFTIKRYPDHKGVTDMLHQLHPGDELIIRDVWGAIEYKGPGYFIAGGAGITPFLAILRRLHKDGMIADNVLFFSNRTAADIIEEKELDTILGKNAVFVLSKEALAARQGEASQAGQPNERLAARQSDPRPGGRYLHGRIDADFLKAHVRDVHRPFYVCGPDPMVLSLTQQLTDLGASPETLVFEK